MNNKLLIPLIIVIAAIGGVAFYMITASTSQDQTSTMSQDVNNAAGTIEEGSGQMVDAADNPIMMDDQSDESNSSRYVAYSTQAYDQAVGKKRVFFFHASWCPTCKVANTEFEANTGNIPQDVVLFKTDYDSQSALKQKYNITYQHTFVLVDSQGNELAKWNGGGIDELVQNTN